MTTTEKPDGRREAGGRTRQRLLDVAGRLMAERGEANVSLREIAEAARSNSASVSYHFGSKDQLCREAVEEAMRTVTEEHRRGIAQLPPNATVADIALVLTETIVKAMTSTVENDRTLVMLSARSILSQPVAREGYERVTAPLFEDLVIRLCTAIPGLSVAEGRFRAHAAAGLLHVISAGILRTDTEGLSAHRLITLIAPVMRGCLAESSLSGPHPASVPQ